MDKALLLRIATVVATSLLTTVANDARAQAPDEPAVGMCFTNGADGRLYYAGPTRIKVAEWDAWREAAHAAMMPYRSGTTGCDIYMERTQADLIARITGDWDRDKAAGRGVTIPVNWAGSSQPQRQLAAKSPQPVEMEHFQSLGDMGTPQQRQQWTAFCANRSHPRNSGGATRCNGILAAVMSNPYPQRQAQQPPQGQMRTPAPVPTRQAQGSRGRTGSSVGHVTPVTPTGKQCVSVTGPTQSAHFTDSRGRQWKKFTWRATNICTAPIQFSWKVSDNYTRSNPQSGWTGGTEIPPSKYKDIGCEERSGCTHFDYEFKVSR